MRELLASMGSQQKNKNHKLWDLSTNCFVCAREKHSCAWAVRGVDTTVVGSWCYCCVQACKKLDCTKNQAVLTAMGDVLDIIRKKSAEIAAGRRGYDGDRCKCKNCTAGGKKRKAKLDQQEGEGRSRMVPVVRLRRKTAPA